MADTNDAIHLPAAETVRDRINTAYDKCLRRNEDGSFQPYACIVCDEFIDNPDNLTTLPLKMLYKYRHRLEWTKFLKPEERICRVEDYYRVNDAVELDASTLPVAGRDLKWLEETAVSPNGFMFKRTNHRNCKSAFTCCTRCKAAIQQEDHNVPAIANKNFVGVTPKCLLDLTEIELAFLTPTKCHGYCFTYTGGKQKNLRGTLVFMRVKERRIARGLVQLETLGLGNNVIVICHGKMTEKQRTIARRNATVRTEKLLLAVEWLCRNNVSWRQVDLEGLRIELQNTTPTFFDHSEMEENQDTNVETKEVFSCYFPDGAMENNNGGFDEPGAFKDFVYRMKEKNCDLEFVCNLEKEFVSGGDSDEFVSSCLLQFPYGIGGMNELRMANDGSFTRKIDLDAYISHLSKISQPQFHRPLFVLILYNLALKRKLLKASFLQVPDHVGSKSIADDINIEDLTQAISNRRNGNRTSGHPACKRLLNAVDATSRAVPHSDDAAKSARSTAETMQHHLGTGSIFLTVTFDDECNFIIQVMADDLIDSRCNTQNLSDDAVRDLTKRRHTLRLKYPGICAMFFDMMLRILIRDVVGWDTKENKPTESNGAYGKCVGFALAIEEQGRKTLHGHMTLWIEGYRQMLEGIHNGANANRREQCAVATKAYIEHVTMTSMFYHDGTPNQMLKTALDHSGCGENNKRMRGLPEVVDDQNLRYLRHKFGYAACEGRFATCPHCDRTWTYEELLSDFLVVGQGVHATANPPIPGEKYPLPLDRMRAMVVQYQKDRTGVILPPHIVNALCQHHNSNHVKSCFKCNGKRKHVCTSSCECRYRLPDCARKRANVRTLEEGGSRWFSWTGEREVKDLLDIQPSRHAYDLFQNVSSPAISASKFSCNNNVSLLSEGPIAQYQFKYNFKKTNQDDVEEYGHVLDIMKRTTLRKHDDDRAEARRKIIAASFGHAKKNIIGPALASHITRHGQRYRFSHQCTYCPLADLEKLIRNQSVGGVLETNKGRTYFENCALHYLCRNEELEYINVWTFYTEFKTARNSKKAGEEDEVLPFIANTGYYKHPSAETRGGVEVTHQGVTAREVDEIHLLKVAQWVFPDTADFGGNILTSDDITEKMELYARLVLILLVPFRSAPDLHGNSPYFPYVTKFREVYEEDQRRERRGTEALYFTEETKSYLQNLQNARANSLRLPHREDELSETTVPYHPPDVQRDHDDNNAAPTNNEPVNALDLDHLNQMFTADNAYDPNDFHDNAMGKSISFEVQRNNGKNGAGYNPHIRPVPFNCDRNGAPHGIGGEAASQSFVRPSPGLVESESATITPRKERKKYSMSELVRLYFRVSTVRTNAALFHEDVMAHVLPANGTAKSILNWADCARLDRDQSRAFECIISAFILTFYDEVPEDTTQGLAFVGNQDQANRRSQYGKTHAHLKLLRGSGDTHLICFLHGPGGSGKTTVINLVQGYAKHFCEELGHPFTSRTIVITAMSGVAATLILGETTHSAFYLNKKNISEEEKEAWADTRLAFIDETSFAAARDYVNINQACKTLMRQPFKNYGGLNIVFAGDLSQMEPVRQEPVYVGALCPEFEVFVNVYIELNGMHRFCDDLEWGLLLRRFREGEVTLEDIQKINSECLVGYRNVPEGIQVACHGNKERCAVNCNVFDQYCDMATTNDADVVNNATLIFMDNLQMKNADKVMRNVTNPRVKQHFYDNCGDSSLELGGHGVGRVDPILKLYTDCPLMMTKNKNVIGGQANGSKVLAKGVYTKPGETPYLVSLVNGRKIRAFTCSQIHSLLLEHQNDLIRPRQFQFVADSHTGIAKIPDEFQQRQVRFKGTQFSLVSNSATTGHKLQGATVESLLVNDWNYNKNWVYVVLSRVRTMLGLFIQKKLSTDMRKYAMAPGLRALLRHFRDEKTISTISLAKYAEMREGM